MTQENRGLGQILGVPRVQGTKGCGATPPSIQSVKRPICQSVNFALPHPRSPCRTRVRPAAPAFARALTRRGRYGGLGAWWTARGRRARYAETSTSSGWLP